jgi:hypothetical protein
VHQTFLYDEEIDDGNTVLKNDTWDCDERFSDVVAVLGVNEVVEFSFPHELGNWFDKITFNLLMNFFFWFVVSFVNMKYRSHYKYDEIP